MSNLLANGRDEDRRITPRVNERQLIARVIAGDRLAGRALYDTHAPRVYSLAARLLLSLVVEDPQRPPVQLHGGRR